MDVDAPGSCCCCCGIAVLVGYAAAAAAVLYSMLVVVAIHGVSWKAPCTVITTDRIL